ncbi:hypothetical protein OU995_18780 [Roseateles sp. SL47]|nr:hypothetical protein OU995_18780 [Roseateles sp. SL47]
MKLFHMSLLALSVAVPLVAAARPPVPTVPAWPVIPSGPNVRFFTETLGEKPQPLSPSLRTPILAVIAEGDLVTVLYPRVVRTEQGAYTTTWYDTWRIVGGKADEHWDPALKGESPVLGTP